ncbi:hypothetical protein [Faecalibacillus faecis]|uniref:hypothetical protein n=1 Tax=Faecalibacillus faecis TaxID=1982628 RepID=UPI003870C569
MSLQQLWTNSYLMEIPMGNSIDVLRDVKEKTQELLYQLTDSDFNGDNFEDNLEEDNTEEDCGLNIAMKKFESSVMRNDKLNICKLENFIKTTLYDAYNDNYYTDVKVTSLCKVIEGKYCLFYVVSAIY